MKMLNFILVLWFFVVPTAASSDTYTEYRAAEQIWIIGNRSIRAYFQLDPAGRFRYRALEDRISGREWQVSAANPSSPPFV